MLSTKESFQAKLMNTPMLTILGLGPGSIYDLTVQAHTLLTQAAEQQQIVYFRTTLHPAAAALKQELPELQIRSFDHLYDESDAWDTLYERIASEVCQLAAQQPIIYAVPGHPLIGESSVQLLVQQARERGITTRIVAGLSLLEPVCELLSLDPYDRGLQILEATRLAALESNEIAGALIPTAPLLIPQIYNRRLASDIKLVLGELYPDEWPVRLVRLAGLSANEEPVLEIPLYELDRTNVTNHLCTLYVPPVDELTSLRLPETLRYITMRLRRDPDGCPWDREQTHQSLTRYVIEETYEVVEALEENDMEKLAEELGDLLLQVYLHAEIARQEGDFSLGDVYEQINAKMIRRHPHVFGTAEAETAGQVALNWEEIKKEEKRQAGIQPEETGLLDGVPQGMPATMIAQKYQKRAMRAGFRYDQVDEIITKLGTELEEFRQANTAEERLDELGDILFVVVLLASWFKLDAEEALRHANRKFKQRFQSMERLAREEGRDFSSYTSAEWLERWQRAKTDETHKSDLV
uniref:Nucleoside triphosphate pyrophosphohydrolase n=1 Tax=Thermosporothrix sp. COM3 TaxID=2490863 RepID=A0A455STB4_9CHLR|nr:nucleoside triphosphate pyrophosphohydrolase [Thermosporothrix sp. COM3]